VNGVFLTLAVILLLLSVNCSVSLPFLFLSLEDVAVSKNRGSHPHLLERNFSEVTVVDSVFLFGDRYRSLCLRL